MIWYFLIIGFLMGSFLAVVGDRWSNDQSIVKPRSHCVSCGHTLVWYELIPIFSYLFLRGKCSKCGEKFSIMYPVLELITGVLFALAYYWYGLSGELIISLSLISLLIITCVSDFKYLLILDIPLLITCFIVLLVNLYLYDLLYFTKSLLFGLILFLFMWGVKYFGDKKFKRESLGGGDVKIAFLIGCTLHFSLGFISLVVASFLTYPLALYYIFRKKEKEIPFGPFLVMGLIICYVFAEPIMNLLTYLSL